MSTFEYTIPSVTFSTEQRIRKPKRGRRKHVGRRLSGQGSATSEVHNILFPGLPFETSENRSNASLIARLISGIPSSHRQTAAVMIYPAYYNTLSFKTDDLFLDNRNRLSVYSFCCTVCRMLQILLWAEEKGRLCGIGSRQAR